MFQIRIIILVLTVVHVVNTITVSLVSVTDKNNSSINLTNNTLEDRFRRLIPYMTFYIPTNDYQPPPSQTYSFMPVDTQILNNQIKSSYIKQHHQQLSPYNSQQSSYQTHNQQQPYYYGSRHQSTPKPNIQYDEPQSIKQNHLTPFSNSNKVPGHFTPMIYRESQKNIYDIRSQTKPQIIAVTTPTYPVNIQDQKYRNYVTPQNNFLSFVKSTPSPPRYQSDQLYQIKPYQETNQLIYQNKYIPNKVPYNEYKTIISTTLTPIRNINKFPQQQSNFDDIPERHYRPILTTPPPYQHLTETTQIKPPTLSTQHTLRPPQQQINYYETYNNIKERPVAVYPQQPIHQQQSQPIYQQPQQQSIIKRPVVQYIQNSKVAPIRNVIVPTKRVVLRKPIKKQHQQNEYESNSLADILKKLQDTNQLPHTITSDNIDNSIKTLVKILNDLKKQKIEDVPQQNYHENDYDYRETEKPDYDDDLSQPNPPYNEKTPPGPATGRPGIDYPNLSEIPTTSFNCTDQRYKGFFGDPETSCQVWHYCDLNGGQASFLCPNGTIFSQVALTCDWWFNVKCSSTAQLYVLNERLYKYILPFTPKFPEDYSGPLVDKYLALKFQEMEEKMRKEKKGKISSTTSDAEEEENSDQEIELPSSIETYSSTEQPKSSTTLVPETSVESERVEIIEIKPDGSSGHLIPGQNNYDGDEE